MENQKETLQQIFKQILSLSDTPNEQEELAKQLVRSINSKEKQIEYLELLKTQENIFTQIFLREGNQIKNDHTVTLILLSLVNLVT